MAGGDGYGMLAELSAYDTGVVLYEAMVNYLSDGGVIAEEPQGRIEIVE